MQSTLKNMVITLLLITFVASSAVGVVYMLTKEPIQMAKDAKTVSAIAAVLPSFDNDPSQEKEIKSVDGEDVIIYTAKNGDAVAGYAIESFTNNGFAGKIKLMVGLLPDGTINKIEVLQHAETPGLGDKMESSKSTFSVQFEGKNPSDFKISVKKDGGDVDAITASTISSRAFCDAVTRAHSVYQSIAK